MQTMLLLLTAVGFMTTKITSGGSYPGPLPQCSQSDELQAWKVLNDAPHAQTFAEATAVTNRGCALSGSFRANNETQFCSQTCKQAYCNFINSPAINKCTNYDAGEPPNESFAQYMASDAVVLTLKKQHPCSMIDVSKCSKFPDPLPECTQSDELQAWKVLNDAPHAQTFAEATAVTNRGCALSGSFGANNKTQFCSQTCKQAYCNFVNSPAINKCTVANSGDEPNTESFAQFAASAEVVLELKKLYPCSMIKLSNCSKFPDPIPQCTRSDELQAWKVLNDAPHAQTFAEATAVTNRGCALTGSFRANNETQFCSQTCKQAYCNFINSPAINKCTMYGAGEPITESFAQYVASDAVVLELKRLHPCSTINISSCSKFSTVGFK